MEIIEIIIKLSTPFILGVAVFFMNKNLSTYRSKLTLNVKLIEKRIDLYDEMACELNDIHQFMIRVGNWKDISPEDLIKKKRSIDSLVHKNTPYWSPEFMSCYDSYISECFQTNTGHGKDTKIKADTVKYKDIGLWDNKFDLMFTGNRSNKGVIREKYKAFNDAVSKDLNPK